MPERITNLTNSVDDLAAEARNIRAELRRRTAALWFAVTVGGVILAVVVAAAVVVSLDNRRAIESNNQRWCPLVGLLINRPGQADASTPRGARIAAEADALSARFRCPTPTDATPSPAPPPQQGDQP